MQQAWISYRQLMHARKHEHTGGFIPTPDDDLMHRTHYSPLPEGPVYGFSGSNGRKHYYNGISMVTDGMRTTESSCVRRCVCVCVYERNGEGDGESKVRE